MTPSSWGKYFWTTLHYVALGYPKNPTLADRKAYKAFYESFGKVLPCYKCSVNYDRHLVELPIEPYLVNRASLFSWTVALHNIVNKELGKQEWTVEQSWKHYQNLDVKPGQTGMTSITPNHPIMTFIVVITALVFLCLAFVYFRNKK